MFRPNGQTNESANRDEDGNGIPHVVDDRWNRWSRAAFGAGGLVDKPPQPGAGECAEAESCEHHGSPGPSTLEDFEAAHAKERDAVPSRQRRFKLKNDMCRVEGDQCPAD